jgi:hypothetical protein
LFKKVIITRGIVASVPLIITEQIFFYLTSRHGMEERMLLMAKPILYGLFLFFLAAFPIYFFFSKRVDSTKPLFGIMAITCMIFSVSHVLSGIFIYPGIIKDMQITSGNIISAFLLIFIILFMFQSFMCITIVLLSKKLLRH